MKITNKEEHLENFNMIMKTVKDYLQQNFENKSIIDNFENFFDIDKIIKKDNVTLLNLAKLLLLMTSLSSKKEKLIFKVNIFYHVSLSKSKVQGCY